MNIVIVDYKIGNTQSIIYAFQRLGHTAIVSDDPKRIASADKVILPGVGAANMAMQQLKEKGLDQLLLRLTQPVLGICLGMQLLCSYSAENGTECLGIFPNTVHHFPPLGKVPLTGWNNIETSPTSLFKDIPNHSFMYFVHRYYVGICDHTIANTHYLLNYSAAIQKDNFYGVQFHPEKSSDAGAQLLKNFLAL